MAKTNETGHGKNVANFEKFISVCEKYGEEYKPARPDLKVPAMKVLLTNAQLAMKELKQVKRDSGNATNNRELVFEPLTGLATRIIGSLESCGANALTIEDARSINNKLQGRRATPLPKNDPKDETDPETEPQTRSTSQRSFDNQIEYFGELITAVRSEPRYQPNELELQVESLESILEELKIRNKLASDAEESLSLARLKRDQFLYGDGSGICDIVMAVKAYGVSAFRPNSKKYKNLTKFRFSRKREKK